MEKLMIQYAIDKYTNKIKYVDDVEKGLKCNCICAKCGAILEAMKGNKKAHHFRHYQKCTCAGGPETALHLMAKDIIFSLDEIKTNEYRCFESQARMDKMVWKFLERPRLEEKYNDITPDAIVKCDIASLMIEIFVTHKVDEQKAQRVRELGVNMLEIDLSDIVARNENISREELTAIIKSGMKNNWIYCYAFEEYYYQQSKLINPSVKYPFGNNIPRSPEQIRQITSFYKNGLYKAKNKRR